VNNWGTWKIHRALWTVAWVTMDYIGEVESTLQGSKGCSLELDGLYEGEVGE